MRFLSWLKPREMAPINRVAAVTCDDQNINFQWAWGSTASVELNGVQRNLKTAEFEIRTPDVVGSRIRVTNLDGSTHAEEIVEWQPDQRLQLHMGEFSAPLSRLATGFLETWEFQREANETQVTRLFKLNARSMTTKPILWLISCFLKQAIARHLREMRNDS